MSCYEVVFCEIEAKGTAFHIYVNTATDKWEGPPEGSFMTEFNSSWKLMPDEFPPFPTKAKIPVDIGRAVEIPMKCERKRVNFIWIC